MEVFRLSRKIFSDSLSGKGAAIKGARWNSIGVEIIYTASNRSLAMAEVAVHLTIATIPDNFMMLTIYIPDDILIKKLNSKDLPLNWNAFPPPNDTQFIGDEFIANKQYCVLQIPSAVTKGDYNILLNPNHPDFSRIKIIEKVDFPFDKRLFE